MTKHMAKTLTFILPFLFFVGINTTIYAQNEPIDDTEITSAVSDELLQHVDVPSYLIDVVTTDGIVTLTGSTDNILAKDRAGHVAMAVKGVRGVINQIDVNAPERSNADIKADIEQRLLNDPATDSYEIGVGVSDGEITLTGEVESWQEKQLTAQVAKGVKGVTAVFNNIEMNYTEERPDVEIYNDIVQSMENDIRIDHVMVDVEVDNGKVELSGVVGSATEKGQAELLSWVPGVTDVNSDDLEIKYWARDSELRKNKYADRSDEQIREAVIDAFWYAPRVNYVTPTVRVNDGVVTLSGKVENLKTKHAAEQTASNIVGVQLVRNELKVRSEVPADAVLKARVTTALIIDPFVGKFEITTEAKNGKVYLYGDVDTYFEKYQAEDVVSQLKGVTNIFNFLSVNDDEYAYNKDYYYYDYSDWYTYYPSIYTGYTYVTPPNDAEIKDNVESELWWSPFVNESDVHVSVDNGTVTLTGTVETWNEKDAATENAFEGGADLVINNITVE